MIHTGDRVVNKEPRAGDRDVWFAGGLLAVLRIITRVIILFSFVRASRTNSTIAVMDDILVDSSENIFGGWGGMV